MFLYVETRDEKQLAVGHFDKFKVLYHYATPIGIWVQGAGNFQTAKTHSMTSTKHFKTWAKENGGSVGRLVDDAFINWLVMGAGETVSIDRANGYRAVTQEQIAHAFWLTDHNSFVQYLKDYCNPVLH